MSDPMNDDLRPDCAAVDDDLVELALGTLTGKERVAALAHLETCARCSSEVEELSAAADQLLHLAPEAEPPLGFEARVFERLGLSPVPAGRTARLAWRQKPFVAAAAAVVVVAVGLGALVGYNAHGNGPAPLRASVEGLQMAPLVSRGHPVGTVLVYAGNPTWLFMYMDDPNGQGALRCQVVVDQGPAITLGTFWLSDGKGAWAASVGEPAGRIRQARVVSATGKVLAVARLA